MLKVIGLGYPRTGTMSLKHSIEALGLGPCYHMIEVFHHPHHVPFWLEAIKQNGENTDWAHIFEDFKSSVDAPACYFWRALEKCYPDAKFVLTVREPESWYASVQSTIYEAVQNPQRAPSDEHRVVQAMVKSMIFDWVFEGRFDDRDYTIQNFEEHNRGIQDFFSEDRLLVLKISEGWKPLCEFLNIPVPDIPFPCSNSRVEFQKRFDVSADE